MWTIGFKHPKYVSGKGMGKEQDNKAKRGLENWMPCGYSMCEDNAGSVKIGGIKIQCKYKERHRTLIMRSVCTNLLHTVTFTQVVTTVSHFI